MNSTGLPFRGVHAIIGSLPTWSTTTSAPDALAAEGSVTGTGAPHESPFAWTLTPVMARVSLETRYSMLGLHSLMVSVWYGYWRAETGREEGMYLLKGHAVEEQVGDIVVLQRSDWPVGKSRELLRDDLDPDLQQRQLAAHITHGELRCVLTLSTQVFLLAWIVRPTYPSHIHEGRVKPA